MSGARDAGRVRRGPQSVALSIGCPVPPSPPHRHLITDARAAPATDEGAALVCGARQPIILLVHACPPCLTHPERPCLAGTVIPTVS